MKEYQISIGFKAGSDYQEEFLDDIVRAYLAAIEAYFSSNHKENRIETQIKLREENNEDND
jgi:hypothetical protein